MVVHVNIEGQVALSFALGLLFSPYTYAIIWLVLFFIIWEIGYYLIYKQWFLKIRLGLIAAYILGLIVGVYILGRYIPFY